MPEPVTLTERKDNVRPCPSDFPLFHALSHWREKLARTIARNNLGVRSDGITEAVNRILFFLIFFRIALDRGFIERKTIQSIRESEDLYRTFMDLAAQAGDPWEDLDSYPASRGGGNLVVEDHILRPILEEALDPEQMHELASIQLPALASIFSRYLQKTIKRSAAHHATIVSTRTTILSPDSPDPTEEMIGYMVETALHAAGINRSKREVLPLRVADIACGSGRVLAEAFGNLVRTGRVRRSFAEKRQVLFDSIYGLDADRHAVAAARMILVIGLMDGETAGSLPDEFFLTSRDTFRALRYTIQHGNALIGPGIAHEDCWMFVSPKERHDLAPFSWENGFPEIFTAGGFDVIIGNFPGGPLERKEWVHQYFQQHFLVYDPEIDRSVYMVDSGFQFLRPGGVFSFCMSNQWLRGRSGGSFRSFMKAKQIREIVDFPAGGGNRINAGLCIVRVTNCRSGHEQFRAAAADLLFTGNLGAFIKAQSFPVDPETLPDGGWVLRDSRRENLLAKIAGAGTPLGDVVMGQVHGGDPVDPRFIINSVTRDRLISEDPGSKSHIYPIISDRNIKRYGIFSDRFVILIPRGWTASHPASVTNPWRWFKRRHPSLAKQLRNFFPDRKTGQPENYWWEGGGFNESFTLRSSIIFPTKFRNREFALTNGRTIPDDTVTVIESTSLFLLALLNSRLTSFFLDNPTNKPSEHERFSKNDLLNLPLYIPDPDDPTDCRRCDKMIALVRKRIDRQKLLHAPVHESTGVRLQREIAGIERNIDALVYDFYRFTQEEIVLADTATVLPDPEE